MQLSSTCRSVAETTALGIAIGAALHGGDLVALRGALGAGKTTITKGIVAGLGATSEVRSPTFAFIHHHRSDRGGIDEVLHVDLYRLDDARELEGIGLLDLLDPSVVCLVEWMERAEGLLGNPSVEVALEARSDDVRHITITAQDGSDFATHFERGAAS